MKLLSLTLNDFRQFRGTQRIDFANDDARNATLVYGPNGGGKTTLLNAFVWVLYGAFTEDFEQPERLIHGDTWVTAPVGSKLRASVELRFEHDDKRYELIREVSAEKRASEQRLPDTRGGLRLLVTNGVGATEEPNNPNDYVARILPEDLHKFFFFNGERIENLTKHAAYKELAGATKTLLGLEVMERGIQHLPRAAKEFETELARLGTSGAQDIKRALDAKREEAERVAAELSTAFENVAALDDRRDAVFAELSKHTVSRALQERRDNARQRRKDAEARMARVRDELRDVITRDGFVAFTERLGTRVAERFEDLEERGELPAPVKEPFVRELLDRGMCICGTPLTEGSSHRAELEAFLGTAGSPELETAWNRLDGLARRLADDRVAFRAALTRLLKERDAAAQERQQAIEIESEVSHRLKGADEPDVQALEERQRAIAAETADLQQRIGRLNSERKRLEAAIEEGEKEFAKQAKQDDASRSVQECLDVAREAEATLKRVREALTEGVRQQLNERIAATYDRISARTRFPELSSQFELRLYEEDVDGTRRLAPNSTSENTILALSFVGGLVDYARAQAEGKIGDEALQRLVEGTGGSYPVVIDAAFGSLDESYKLEVARALPLLAPQLVTLLSKAQAEGTAQELAPRVGRRYVIISHVAKADRDEDLELDGRTHPYRRVCAPGEERAEIMEVT